MESAESCMERTVSSCSDSELGVGVREMVAMAQELILQSKGGALGGLGSGWAWDCSGIGKETTCPEEWEESLSLWGT